MRKMKKKVKPPKPVMEFIQLAKEPGGTMLASIHWEFATPKDAGLAVGQLTRTLVRAFERDNPGKSREEITLMLVGGLREQLNGRFLNGDNSDAVIKH